MRASTSAAVLGSAALASAQLGGLSASCTTAATGLLTGSAASCLQVSQLTSVIASGSNTSIVPALTTYVQSICTSAPCSSSVISSAQSSISSGCSSDIASGNAIAILLSTIFSDYTDVRGLICTQGTSNGSYCLPSTLSAVQSATGQPITLNFIEGLLSGSSAQSFLSNLPAGAVCTDCGHAIVTEASKIAATNSSSAANTIKSAAASKCGSSFSDGAIPSSVTTSGSGSGSSSGTSSSGTSSNNSGAMGAFSSSPMLAIAGAGLAAVAGGFAVLL